MPDASKTAWPQTPADPADDSRLGAGELGFLAWSQARRRALQRAGIHEFELDLGPDPAAHGALIGQLLGGSAGGAIHVEDREQLRAALLVAVASGLDFDQTYRVVQDDGALRWLRATACGADPGTGRIFGVLQDVTDAKLREAALEEALHEVDHRVKNSLQLTSSLIALQAGAAGNEEMRAAFHAIRGRVQAIASVHASLFREEEPGEVDARAFLSTLVHDLARSAPGHEMILASDDAKLPASEAASLAIALNELLSNVFSNAYPGGRGKVFVTFRIDPAGNFRLNVADERRAEAGLSDDAVGQRILRVLAQRWGGSLEIVDGGPGRVATLSGRI